MSTEQNVGELKLQGAMEASRDPQSSVTANDAEEKMVRESKSAGIAAYTFDPDASPEEKMRQARAAVPKGFHSKRNKGIAIATDIDDDDGKPDFDLPPPSKAGAIERSEDTGDNGDESADGKAVMGPQTGWSPRFGWPSDDDETLLDSATWLEDQIPDKFYGDWYYNAAVIVFACISSWLVAILGGGLGWVMIIMAICSTYYRTSLRRVRRNFRDDITRDMALKKLETDTESLEWINSFMVKFWPIYQPVLAQTVINAVDQVLSTATPSFLDSLKLKSFTLGSKPPRMEHVRTYPKVEDDLVVMDWKFSFTPNDVADMTSRQLKNKINPKVVLEIRVGKAMISKGLDVIVEDMSFSGIMQLKIKLQIPFPHVEKIEMCFLERPKIDYVCKPLGGETFGFDINFIPGLEGFILEQIHGNLAPMMYAPKVFPIEVAKMLAGTPVDQAIGVVAVTLHGAHGLKNTDKFSGKPDPYAVLSLSQRQALAQTKVQEDTSNPRWNETHFVIITSFNESLDIQVFDFNDIRKDKKLGVASFQLKQVEDNYEYENERIEIISDGKVHGAVSCDIRFFPVLEPTQSEDGTEEPPPETNSGIMRFTVEQAKDLDGSKSLVGLLNPYATLTLNGKTKHVTKKLKRTNNPIWDDGSKEMLITDRRKANLGIVIKDDRDLAGDQTIGSYQISLNEILEMMEKGKEWYVLKGAHTGRVKMTAQWKPVAISGAITGTGGYSTPIGVMRLHFKNAKDLRNFETLGKSDPYTRVLLSGVERARTVTFRNDLNPEWDEVLYIPVHSPREKLTLEVMDSEKMGRDRSLGSIEILAGDYISKDIDGEYKIHDQKVPRSEGLKLHGKGIPKGELNYSVAFYPTLWIADPDEEEEEQAAEEKNSLDVPRSAAADAGKFSASFDKDKDVDGSQPPLTPKSPLTPVSTFSGRKSREEPKPRKIKMSPQDLLKHDSGLIIFKLMEAELPKSGARVEVYVDDMAFPSYVSPSAKHKKHTFDEMGDCVIRELEFSRLTIKIRERTEKPEGGDEEHTLASLAGNTLDTLKQCLNNPTVLQFNSKDDDGRPVWVKVSLKYIPIRMQLDPSESINNMGNLRVDVLDATDLPAADRNGKSDPYCKFELNGLDVYKTKVQKKTLHPVWNEFFEVPVPSRTGALFNVKIYDYDFADKPDFLGGADINLEQLEPFGAQEVKLLLDGKSGTLRLRLLFKPNYVTRTRMGTSTFSGTFSGPSRIVTGVAGAPIKGGVAVAGILGHGANTVFKRGFGKKRDKDADEGVPPVPSMEIPTIVENGEVPASRGTGLRRATGISLSDVPPKTPPAAANGGGEMRNHNRTTSIGATSVYSINSAAAAGTATFTIVSASGFPPTADLYIAVNQVTPKSKTVGKTKHFKSATGEFQYDETFKCTCTPDTTFQVQAKGEHMFGSDDDLGETAYYVDESGSNQEKELKVGSGTVVIKSNFVPPQGHGGTDSPKSALRRSFLNKRETRSRDGTPS